MATGAGRGTDPLRPAPARRLLRSAPALQALVLAGVLATDLVLVDAARDDLAAERGEGPVVAVAAAERRAAAPVRVGIPRLAVTSTLIGLRKDREGRLQVPQDPMRAGWYAQGPAPGDRGPAVIAGHVDSYRGPGVFARLDELRKDDVIKVRRADGTLRSYAVTLVRTYAKRDFPTSLVYEGDGRESLRLITCGGDFDRRSKSYRSNVVVFAKPV